MSAKSAPNRTLELAHVTCDGSITGVSDTRQTHPVFGTDAYEVEFRTHLRLDQLRSAHAIICEEKEGEIKPMVLRSSIGQLAMNAGDPHTTNFYLQGDVLVGQTLLTHLNGARSERVFEAMLTLARDRYKTIFLGRAAILPSAARLGKAELQELIREGELVLSDDAGITDTGELLLPLEGKQHQFSKHMSKLEVLDELLRGSGREVLKAHRSTPSNIPKHLKPNRFLVGNVHISTPQHHMFLRSVTLIRGLLSKIFHTEAVGLIAGRTNLNSGDRQFEIKNAGDTSVVTKDVRIVADVYHPAHVERAGV